MIGETALILAALALLLALAAIMIAWQMWRRSQRKLDAMSTLMRELSRSRDSYRKQLEELQTANIGMGKKLADLGRQLGGLQEQQQELALKDPQSKLYSRAARMVQLGADVEEIMAECEMPRAEAELLLSLHRQR
ncbi:MULTISPECIES: DUF2802 domain-containing protein [Oceanimonas]|uniref:DNA repair protein n=1 Tax=Oceanimonas doudoroffii TaxID=84158 RepID=A0A233RIL7_9GAMM|nr:MULTISPECIES: DUF2802 domain-containing protein [Oceanimonas]NHI00177.1 hypothetical protein [Oceanimonas sp. MB9]OXY83230.1 hypothetical protein B6S08_06980 [Oceanimonas doudoroffii]